MEYWLYDGERHYKVGLNAVVGRPMEERSFEPSRFDEMRRGAWDIDARVARHGPQRRLRVAQLPVVARRVRGPALPARRERPGPRARRGARRQRLAPRGVGRHASRAGSSRARCRGCSTRELAADEIRRNAARGFRAVTFPELPERLGLPSLHTGYWDPFMAACEETGTVICLHVGSSSSAPITSSDAPADTIGVLFFGWAMFAAVDWLYSQDPGALPRPQDLPLRGRPRLGRRACSTGSTTSAATSRSTARGRASTSRRARSCSATSGSARSTTRPALEQRHRIGIDHVLLETDYPHQDGTWPDTQELLHEQIGHFPAEDIRKLTWENAAELFQHPVPDAVRHDPDAY